MAEKDLIKEEEKAREKRREERATVRETIHEGLIEQLHDRNIFEPHFTDLVNDYVSLWDVKSELIYDIETKGVSIRYQNGQNQFGYKRNDSIAELNRVNSQMLTILRDLGLKVESKKVNEDEEAFDL